MDKVFKLVLLDKALLKPYYKYFLVILAAPLVMTLTNKNIIYGILFCTIITAMTSSYTFKIAEKNDITKLYGLLPVTKKDIVVGRYLFTAILGVIAIAVTILLNIVILTFMKVSFTTDDIIFGTSSALILYFFFTSIQLPGYFRFGSIKGSLFSYMPLIGMFLLGFIVNSTKLASHLPGFLISVLSSALGTLVFVALVSVVLYGISMGVAQMLYEKLEQ